MSPAPVPGEGAGPPGQEAVSIRLTYHSFSPSPCKNSARLFSWFAKVPGSGTGRYPSKGLVRVPVQVPGRDLCSGPILLAPVHCLNRDALQVAPVQVALLQRFGARYRSHPCKGLGAVPVHVLGRDLRFGPILRVPVHRLDRDPHLPRNALVKNAKNVGNRLAEASLIPYICHV